MYRIYFIFYKFEGVIAMFVEVYTTIYLWTPAHYTSFEVSWQE